MRFLCFNETPKSGGLVKLETFRPVVPIPLTGVWSWLCHGYMGVVSLHGKSEVYQYPCHSLGAHATTSHQTIMNDIQFVNKED